MIDLKNRTIDNNGQVTLKDEAILEILFMDSLELDDFSVEISEEVEQFNKWAKVFGLNKFKFAAKNIINHKENQESWLIPQEFLDFNIEEYILDLCKTKEQLERVELELNLYRERNLLPLLKFLSYIISIMRENDIVWGAGRGSSVSSYVLYLLGLHKVDSLRYDLEISEFLR